MSEFELQCDCVVLLRAYQAQNKIDFFTSIPNSTFTTSWKAKMKNKASGLNPGLPDLMIVKNGDILWVELKVGYNKPSEAQKNVIKLLNQNQTQAILAYDFDEFRLGLDTWLKGKINKPQNAYCKANRRGAKNLTKLFDKK